MILIEGPDGAGKSTLARELGAALGLNQTHSPGPRGARERTYDALGEAVKGNSPVRIHDRLYYSEIVYGIVLRGRVEFSHRERVYVETVLHGALNVPTIFCMPPLETVVKNVEDTGEGQLAGNIPVVPHIKKIYAKYDQIVRNLTWMENARMIRYNYLDTSNKGIMMEVIQKYLELRTERTW